MVRWRRLRRPPSVPIDAMVAVQSLSVGHAVSVGISAPVAVPFSLSVPASVSVFAGGRRAELNERIQIDRDQQVLYATQFAVSLLCACPLCLLSASPPLCLYLVLTMALCMALSKRL